MYFQPIFVIAVLPYALAQGCSQSTFSTQPIPENNRKVSEWPSDKSRYYGQLVSDVKKCTDDRAVTFDELPEGSSILTSSLNEVGVSSEDDSKSNPFCKTDADAYLTFHPFTDLTNNSSPLTKPSKQDLVAIHAASYQLGCFSQADFNETIVTYVGNTSIATKVGQYGSISFRPRILCYEGMLGGCSEDSGVVNGTSVLVCALEQSFPIGPETSYHIDGVDIKNIEGDFDLNVAGDNSTDITNDKKDQPTELSSRDPCGDEIVMDNSKSVGARMIDRPVFPQSWTALAGMLMIALVVFV